MKLKIILWRIFEFYNVFTWLCLTQWHPRKKCNPTSVFQHQRIAVVVLRHQQLESLLINISSCGLNWMTLLIRPGLCLVDHHRIFLSRFCLKGSSSVVFTHSFSLARVSQLTTATDHAMFNKITHFYSKFTFQNLDNNTPRNELNWALESEEKPFFFQMVNWTHTSKSLTRRASENGQTKTWIN